MKSFRSDPFFVHAAKGGSVRERQIEFLKSTALAALVAAGIVAFAVTEGSAQATLEWDGASPGDNAAAGGAGDWNATGAGANNWVTGGAASTQWIDGSNAVFGGTAGTVTINPAGTRIVESVNFATTGYTVTGGTINANGAGVIINGTGFTQFNVAAGTATVASGISGGGVAATGAGTLILSGANTFTNLGASAGGTLQLGSNFNGGNINIGGATLNIDAFNAGANSLIVQNGTVNGTTGILTIGTGSQFQNSTINANLAGAGSVNVFPGTVTLSGDNTFTGVVTIDNAAEVIVARSDTALGASGVGSETIVTNGGTLSLNQTPGNADINIASEILSLEGNLNNVAGNNTFGGPVTLTGNSNFISTAGTLTVSGTVGLGANTLGLAGAGDLTVSGVISGAGGLLKSGNGTATLSGANTYDGPTQINAGTLLITNAAALGTTSAGTSLASGATLSLQNNISVGAEALSLAGGTLNNAAGNNAFGGPVTLTGNSNFISTAGTLTVSGTVDLGANFLGLAGAGNLIVSGDISGTGGLVKSGNGTATLGGANTYTGVTQIDAGTLQISASERIADTSDLVLNGGTFNLNNFTETVGNLSGAVAAANITTGGTSGRLNVNSDADTFYIGGISGATGGSVYFEKSGSNLLILGGPNTTTGSGVVLVSGGQLQATGGNAIGDNNAVNVSGAGSIFSLFTDQTETIGLLSSSASASIVLNGAGSQLTIGGESTANTRTNQGVISGAGSVVVDSGTSTQRFTGAQTYTGSTTVSSGVLELSGNGALASTAVNVTGGELENNVGGAGGLAAGATVTVTGGTFDNNAADSITTLTINGAGAIVDLAGGDLTTADASLSDGTLQGGTLNTGFFAQTGGNLVGTTVNSGYTLTAIGGTVTSFNSTGVVATNASGSGIQLLGTAPLAPVINGTVDGINLNNSNGGAVTVTIANDVNGTEDGIEIVSTGGGPVNLQGTGNIGGGIDGVSIGSAGGTATFMTGGNVTGTAGAGVRLGGNNAMLTVNAGHTVTGGAAAIVSSAATANADNAGNLNAAASTGALFNVTAGNFTLNNNGVAAGVISSSATATTNFNNTVTWNLNGGIGTLSGADTVTNTGTTTVAGNTALNGLENFNNNANGLLNLTGGDFTGLGTLANASNGGDGVGGNAGVTVGAGRTLSAANATNSGELLVSNTGVFTSTGGLIQSGGTTTNNGIVNGNVIANGGTIQGTGTYSNDVTINAGATLAAGTSPGTLNIGGNLLLNAGSISDFEFGTPGTINGATNDLVNVAGNVTVAGTLNLGQPNTFVPGPPTAIVSGFYNLFDADGTVAGAYTAVNNGGVNALADVTQIITNGGGGPSEFNILVNNAGQDVQFWDGAKLNNQPGDTAPDGGTGTWNAANTNWTTVNGQINSNWQSEVGVFGGTAGTVTVNGAQSFQGLQFATTGYVLNGPGTLSMTGDPVMSPTASFFNTDPGVVATVNASITGNPLIGLRKIGSGTLVLGGFNTYTGLTTISAGTLELQNGNAIADGAVAADGVTGSVVIDTAGAALVVTNSETIASLSGVAGTSVTIAAGQTLTTGDAGNDTFAGVVSGDGGLTKQGVGAFTLSGANTYTGLTTVSGGTLELQGGAAIADGAVGADGTTGSVVLSTAGATLAVTNSETIASLSGVAGTGVTLAPGQTLTTGDAGNDTFAGVISDLVPGSLGNLVKQGAGTLTLSGANTYTGLTSVNTGVLNLTGAIAGPATIAAGAQLTSTGTLGDAATDLVTVNGTLDINGGAVNGAVVVSAGATATNSGAINNGLTNNSTTAGFTNEAFGAVTGGVFNTGTASNAGTIDSVLNSNVFTNTNIITSVTNNSGTFNSNGGILNGVVNNAAGGVFNQSGTTLGTGTFINNGVLNAFGVNSIGGPGGGLVTFNNGGTLNSSGFLAINAASASNSGLIDLGSNNTVGDTVNISGNLNGTGGAINVDIDLSRNNAGGEQLSDRINVGSLSGTGGVINLDQIGGTVVLQDNPVVVIDSAGANTTGGTYTATGLPQPSGIILHQFLQLGDDYVVLSQVNPAAGGIAGNITLVQSLIGSVVNRPTSPFVSGIVGEEDPVCGYGSFLRGTGGQGNASGDTFNQVIRQETEIDVKYTGIQFAIDFGCYNSDSGFDISVGAFGGYNTGDTVQDVFLGATGISTSTTFSDFKQGYVGGYVTLAKDSFSGDLQARYGRTEFSFDNPSLGLNDSGLESDRLTLSGSGTYTKYLSGDFESVSMRPFAGFSLSTTSADVLSFAGNLQLAPEDFFTAVGFAGLTIARDIVAESGVEAYQPFITATIYNDFGDDPNAIFTDLNSGVSQVIESENLGAFAEISAGFNYLKILDESSLKQLTASFRADYKIGDQVEGFGVTGQVRLQF